MSIRGSTHFDVAKSTLQEAFTNAESLGDSAEELINLGNTLLETLGGSLPDTSNLDVNPKPPGDLKPEYTTPTFELSDAPRADVMRLDAGLVEPKRGNSPGSPPSFSYIGRHDRLGLSSLPRPLEVSVSQSPRLSRQWQLSGAFTPTRPSASLPTRPSGDYADAYALPEIRVGDQPTWGVSAPELDTTAFRPGAKPTLPTLVAPTVVVPALPAVPDWTAPDDVELSDITLPTLMPLTLPDVSSIHVPSLSLPELQGRLDFTDETFDDTLVQELMAEVRAVLGGRLAIPGHIWTRIWERVAADVNRQYLARKREAQRAHAKLGWSMPGGVLLEAMQVAATDINAEISAKANEIAIKQAEMQQADYWQAMQQGVACATLLSQIHNARQERLLKAAVALTEAQVAVYNATVTAYNAVVQGLNVEIETNKLALQTELTKVEVYKTEMEGAKLGVEVDKAKVEMYVAQWQAVKTQAEAYESMVRGVAAQVEAQKSAVEAYGEQVKAQSAIVQMWATEWDGYAKTLEAEKLKLGKYETEARVFEAEVGAYRAWVEAQSANSKVKAEQFDLALKRAQVETGLYQAEQSGHQIALGLYEADIKHRAADVEWLRADVGRYQAEVAGLQTDIDKYKAGYEAMSHAAAWEGVRAQMQNSYAAIYNAEVSRGMLDIEIEKLKNAIEIEYSRADQAFNQAVVSQTQADAQYKAAQLGVEERLISAAVERYKADASGQAAIAQTMGDMYKAGVTADTARLTMLAERAKILTAQWQTTAQVSQAQYQAAASVYAQLGSAAYAATNASISSSGSDSWSDSSSFSENYNYSGQISG